VVQALLHPKHGCEREYHVSVWGAVAPETARRLAAGVELEDGRTLPCRVRLVGTDPRHDTSRLVIVLREGRKRQIRRSLAALGHPVRRLVRVRMGPLRLGELPRGRARELSPAERRALLRFTRGARPRGARGAHGDGSSRATRPAARAGRRGAARKREDPRRAR
jgi:16S rRNA U516 pseudouridylate synthase RsuA-like enzyme